MKTKEDRLMEEQKGIAEEKRLNNNLNRTFLHIYATINLLITTYLIKKKCVECDILTWGELYTFEEYASYIYHNSIMILCMVNMIFSILAYFIVPKIHKPGKLKF